MRDPPVGRSHPSCALAGVIGRYRDIDNDTSSPVSRRYFLFHMTSSWGVSIAEVHLEELLTIPFPFPERTANPQRSREVVSRVAARVRRAMSQAAAPLVDRSGLVRSAQE